LVSSLSVSPSNGLPPRSGPRTHRWVAPGDELEISAGGASGAPRWMSVPAAMDSSRKSRAVDEVVTERTGSSS
jgi:hypothetical protein